ncbi:MAG: hypothetical protein ACYTFD_03230 [Planctomycetota bacterium]
MVALVGGVAWAETQRIETPAGSGFVVVATLVPGAGGGEVYGVGDGMPDNDVRFSVGPGLEVNGQLFGAWEAQATYTVTMDYYQSGGQWYVDTEVRNDDTGLVEAQQAGYPLAGRPTHATATGEVVITLTAEEVIEPGAG